MINIRPVVFGALLAAGAAALLPPGVSAVPATPPQPVQPSPLIEARKQVNQAQLELTQAKGQVAKARAKVEAGFKTKEEWVKAQKAVDKAQADLNAATVPALEALHKKADYKAEQAGEKAASDKLEALKGESRAKTEDISDAVNAIAQHKTTLKKMESDAVENDSKILDARQRLDDAKKEMALLQSQVDEAAKADPDYQAALAAVEPAQQKLTDAQASMAALVKSESEARAAKAKAEADAHKTSSSSSGTKR